MKARQRRMFAALMGIIAAGCSSYIGRAVVDAGDAGNIATFDVADVGDVDATDVTGFDRDAPDTANTQETGLDIVDADVHETGLDVVDADVADRAAPSEGGCPPRRDDVQRSCVGFAGERGCGVTYLPAGTFTLGGDVEAPAAIMPGRRVQVSAFYLDRYEVTVARFRRWYQSDTGTPTVTQGTTLPYPNGQSFVYVNVTGPLIAEPVDARGDAGFTWTSEVGAEELRPMNGVSAFTAQAFCQSEGGRLPTEAEWEYAGRGLGTPSHPAGRPYPWGPTSPAACTQARWGRCTPADGGVGPIEVGSYPPAPITACGQLFDLAGNVWELTADAFTTAGACGGDASVDPACLDADGGVNFVMRGGGWQSGVAGDSLAESMGRYLRGAARATTGDLRGAGSASIGFRCAYNAAP